VEAPRLHWDGDCAQLEPGFDTASVEALQSRCPVNVWSEGNVYFGGVHMVDGHDQSAGDPRRGGSAQVFD
jgi:gamma-glutamyltranspeptidase/glutathione hydrolase